MYEELLRECGLTQNEVLVYLALLKLGKAKSGQIVKEAKISGGKIYETLNKLLDKGLVKTVTENGIKHFIANDPNTLKSYIQEKEKSLQEKEKALEKAIPALAGLKFKEEIETVSFVKGMRGIKETIYSLLQTVDEFKTMGVRSSKDEKYNNFWKQWHTERVKLKKSALMLFTDINTDYWRFFKKLPYTDVRSILHLSPSAIVVAGNNVLIFTYEPEFTCIHITQSSIAKSFSGFFDDLWKTAKH